MRICGLKCSSSRGPSCSLPSVKEVLILLLALSSLAVIASFLPRCPAHLRRWVRFGGAMGMQATSIPLAVVLFLSRRSSHSLPFTQNQVFHMAGSFGQFQSVRESFSKEKKVTTPTAFSLDTSLCFYHQGWNSVEQALLSAAEWEGFITISWKIIPAGEPLPIAWQSPDYQRGEGEEDAVSYVLPVKIRREGTQDFLTFQKNPLPLLPAEGGYSLQEIQLRIQRQIEWNT